MQEMALRSLCGTSANLVQCVADDTEIMTGDAVAIPGAAKMTEQPVIMLLAVM
jgi:hypothetical protein